MNSPDLVKFSLPMLDSNNNKQYNIEPKMWVTNVSRIATHPQIIRPRVHTHLKKKKNSTLKLCFENVFAFDHIEGT